ncbi:hypothetical protein DERP_011700 [Dermatophagoides pteronyssinus]|uniref:Uncharacterized protein n=1 Tax=Dermatophagoides pteronyssinus TaxID=6956 RepID=A0ABQ8J359_DERPT|nr:hypothetical protein DERP_011700 [Dermatophagoides pteronyssinus]
MNVNSLPILNQSLIEFIPKNPEFLIDKQTIYGPYQQNISIIFTYLSNDDEQPPPLICYHPNRIKLIGNFFNQKFKLSTTTSTMSNVNHHYQNVSITKTILTINNITLDDYGYYQCNNHRFELTGRPKINIEDNDNDNNNKIISLNVLSHTPIQSQSIIVCLINKIHQHCQTYLIRPIHLLNDCSQNCQIILLVNNFHIKHYHRYYHQNKTTIKLSMELTNRFGRTRFPIPLSSSSKTGIIDDEEQQHEQQQQQDQMLIIINDDQIQLRLIIFIIIILIILIITIIGCRHHPYLQQQQQSDNDDDVITTTNRINSIHHQQQQPSTSAIMKTTYPDDDDDDKNKESNHNNKDQESRLSLSSSLSSL